MNYGGGKQQKEGTGVGGWITSEKSEGNKKKKINEMKKTEKQKKNTEIGNWKFSQNGRK